VKGLLAILGKPKGAPDSEEAEGPDSEDAGGMSASFEKEALSAAKDGDLEGLARALMGYAKACKAE
jgi:hypothetical protein